MENYQLVAKTVLKKSGMQNLTPELAVKTGKFIGPLDALINSFNSDLDMKKKSPHHKMDRDKDLKVLVEQVHNKARLFNQSDEGRKLDGDVTFSKDPFVKIDTVALLTWMNEHKKKFHADIESCCSCSKI